MIKWDLESMTDTEVMYLADHLREATVMFETENWNGQTTSNDETNPRPHDDLVRENFTKIQSTLSKYRKPVIQELFKRGMKWKSALTYYELFAQNYEYSWLGELLDEE